jgi:hypothetical protein
MDRLKIKKKELDEWLTSTGDNLYSFEELIAELNSFNFKVEEKEQEFIGEE